MPMTVNAADLTVLPEKPGSMAAMVLMLMRAARLMPAALASHISIRDERALMRWAEDRGILVVDEAAISSFEAGAADLLREAARAKLPWPKPNARRLPFSDLKMAALNILRSSFIPMTGGDRNTAACPDTFAMYHRRYSRQPQM